MNCLSTIIHVGPQGFATIQEGVNAAGESGKVIVAPGVYDENVYISRGQITLCGAQHGKDARERIFTPRKESIIIGSVFLESEDSGIDGFIIRSSSDYAGIITSASYSGYFIQNNVIEGNASGIYMNTSRNKESIIHHNVIRDNTKDGLGRGNGIYSDQGLFNTVISENYITGHCDRHGAGINLETAAYDADILIQRNYLHQDHSIVLTNTENVRITQNCLIGSQTAAVFFGGGTTRTHIEENVIAKNAVGILVSSAFVMKENEQITIHQNEIKKNKNGLYVGLDSYNGLLDASDNYWGSDSGPSIGAQGAGGDVIRNLDFTTTIVAEPFLTMQALV